MRIFKNKWFNRFARQESITDERLIEAIIRANNGLIDADLGGNLIKQRVARPGRGKSSGYRTIVVFKLDDKAVFVYGFAKSDLANLSNHEVEVYKKVAKELLALTDGQIEQLLEIEALVEVKHEQ